MFLSLGPVVACRFGSGRSQYCEIRGAHTIVAQVAPGAAERRRRLFGKGWRIGLIQIDLAGLYLGRNFQHQGRIASLWLDRRRSNGSNRGAGEQGKNQGVEITSAHK